MFRTVWIVLFLAAGTIALQLSYHRMGAPYVGNDGYQYLDAASNLLAGNCLCTNLAHFDEQVAVAHMPVPFTHFAPGYPLLVAVIARTGLRLETSAYLISAAGFLITIWLLWDVGLTLGTHPWVIAIFSLLWIANESALNYAATVSSEAVFTAVLMGIAALMVRDLRGAGRQPGLLLALGAAAGAAYALRYAGLFLLPIAGLYIVWRWWRNRETLPWALGGALSAGLITGAIQLRNIIYTGSWRGGFTSGSSHRLRDVAVPILKVFYHLVFGDRVVTTIDVWTVVFLASFLSMCFLALRGWRRRKADFGREFLPVALRWMGLLAGAYTAGLILTALTSIAADFPRYFAPLYPLLLAGIASVVSVEAPRLQFLAIATMAVAILVVQSRSLAVNPFPAAHVLEREVLQQDVLPGVSALEWLRDHVPTSGVLVAVDGQAVHYVLQRPVISVLESEVTSRRTDQDGFHSLMAQHGARYLLVFPDLASPFLTSQDGIPFLRDLASGDSPSWLSLAARARNVAVYECRSCAQ